VVFSQRTGRMVSSGTVVASPAARAREFEKAAQRCKNSDRESETLW
jgi:hypothetical protein